MNLLRQLTVAVVSETSFTACVTAGISCSADVRTALTGVLVCTGSGVAGLDAFSAKL